MKPGAVISLVASALIVTAPLLCPVFAEIPPDFLSTDSSKLVLDNGLVAILKEDHRTPTFALSLFIRTGSATEGEYAGSGITHLIEHLIFKGTSTRNAQQLEAEIKALGADIEAYTSFDYTAFKIQGPRDNIIQILDIFYDIVANPKFETEEFEKEKNVIKKEMSLTQDDPQKYLSRQFWNTAYLVHPYRNPVIGYEDIFNAIKPQDLKAYYERFYIPNNMVLSVVGDINKDAVSKKINQAFSSLKRKSLSLPFGPPEPKQLSTRYSEIPYPISKPYMMLGFHTVGLSDKDLYALDTLSILLGEGNSSILYQELHNKLNLVYGITAYNYTPFDPGMFMINATFDLANKEKVLRHILENIENLKTSVFKKDQLDKAKNHVISAYMFSKQTQESQADDLGISQLLTGDTDFSKKYVEGINAVQAQDIINVAKKYLTKENMTAAILMPVQSAARQPQKESSAIVSRTVAEKRLRNGIRVLASEDKTLPLVSVRVCIKGGLRFENSENNGISNLCAHMLTKGTASRSEDDIFATIESLGGNISAYSANNSFGLYLDIMSKDVKKGIEVLADVLSSPSFPKNKLRILKNDTLAHIQLANDDIFIMTEKRLRERLFAGHPYGMLSIGSAESINKISHRDIVNFYRQSCVGPNITISICGDIDKDEIYKLVASKFGGIKKKGQPAFSEITPAPIPERIEIKEKMDKKQAVVMIGFRSAGLTNPDRYPLQILSSVFSGAAGRLYRNIRQEKGMAYTLGTFGMTGIDAGIFTFYAAASPQDIDSVKDEIINQIKKVCEGDITEEEIDSAKKSLIAKHQIELQTTGDFALKTALDELYGLGYDNYKIFSETIGKISKQEVIQTANRYFTTNSCVVSITIPKTNE